MRVFVVGSTGSLGSLIVRRARDVLGQGAVVAGFRGSDAAVTSRYPDVATRPVDISDVTSLRAACADVDCVISAAPQREPLLQRVAADVGVDTVDVGAHYGAAGAAIGTVGADTTFHLVCAGQAPGITGLMAKELHAETGEPVTVGFLLADGGRSGTAGVADMLRSIGTSTGAPVPFEFPGVGLRRALPLGTSEMAIGGDPAIPMETVVALESRRRNGLLIRLRKLGLLGTLSTNRWVVRSMANPSEPTDDEVVHLAAVSAGRRLDVRSQSDYLATAHAAVAFAQLATERSVRGVAIPAMTPITLDDVIDRCGGVVSRTA